MEIAVHTELRQDSVEAYTDLHRTIPPDLAAALQAAGVRDWRIWRDGTHLFHLIDVVDYRAMRRALGDDPVNQRWQAQVNPLLSTADRYDGDDDGMVPVWRLAQDPSFDPDR